MGDPEQQPPQGEGPGAGEQAGDQPSQEELRQRLEEQLSKVRVQDVMLESVASILNLAARRITKEDERDLEQARLGIDAVRALVEMLEPEPRSQVQSALSELQMLYAREAGGEAPSAGAGEGEPSAPAEQRRPAQGGRRGSGLWTPPGSG